MTFKTGEKKRISDIISQNLSRITRNLGNRLWKIDINTCMSCPATGRKKKAMAAIKVQASASDLQSFSSLHVTFLVVRKEHI